jgi:hypothetical protein
MKASEVRKGGEYLAKVSGKLVAVRITSEALPRQNLRTGKLRGSEWRAVNLDTKRKIVIRSAKRLRGDYRAWCEAETERVNRRVLDSHYRMGVLRNGGSREAACREADAQAGRTAQEPPRAAHPVPETPKAKPAAAPLLARPAGLTRVSLCHDTGIVTIDIPASVPEDVREDLSDVGVRRSRIDGALWAQTEAGDSEAFFDCLTRRLQFYAEQGRIPAVACAG